MPSDTLYGFKTALPKGVDVLELDVHLTADGQVVALHDTTVDRTTDGSGTVEQMTLAQIKALDAAYWFVPDVGTDARPRRRATTSSAASPPVSGRRPRASSRTTSRSRRSTRSSRPSPTR